MPMIDIIGVPFDLSGMRYGTRLGPGAVRLAGLKDALIAQGREVFDHGDLTLPDESTAEGGIRNFEPAYVTLQALRDKVLKSLVAGSMPLMLGGEHTMAIGSVSAALEYFQGDLGLLWIDAHADLNTPGTSWSGNLHGMAVSPLWGLPSDAEGLKDE